MLAHALRAAAGNAGGGGGGVTTLTYDQIVNANAADITIPASANVGDLAILIDTPLSSAAAGIPTLVIPSGWTSVYDFSGAAFGRMRASFSYRVLQSGDPGTSVSGMTGTTASRKAILVFTPDATISAVTGGGGVGEFTNDNPATQTILTSTQSPPALSIAVAYSSSGAPTFSTNTMTVLTSADTLIQHLYDVYNSTPSDDVVDRNDIGINNLIAGCYFAAT